VDIVFRLDFLSRDISKDTQGRNLLCAHGLKIMNNVEQDLLKNPLSNGIYRHIQARSLSSALDLVAIEYLLIV